MHVSHVCSLPAFLLICAAISVAQPPTKAPEDPKAPQPAQSFVCFMQGQNAQSNSPCSKRLFAQALKNLASAVQEYGLLQDSACYSIRDYRFSRGGENSAVPKLKDYSTCERASLFELRDVTVPKK